MGRRYETVWFLSDDGTADEFVGVRPLGDPRDRTARQGDRSTHGVAPFDVRAGSLALARSISYVASGVVLAVVDPEWRRLAGQSPSRSPEVRVCSSGPTTVCCPAVALAGGAERAVELSDTSWHLPSPGATFAGRDVFAPAAAQLCNGVDLTDLGESIDADLLLPGVVALPQADDHTVIAQVLWVDRYGNAQLNVGPDDLPGGFGARIDLRVQLADGSDGWGATQCAAGASSYAELGGGAVGLVLDSSVCSRVSMDQRSAAEELGLDVGDQVTLTASDDAGITQPVTLRRQP